jgi:hypothetical protein
VANRILVVAFALTLVHGSILLVGKMQFGALASSMGLCLNLLGGFLLVLTVVDWVGVRVARVFATPNAKTAREGLEVQDYTNMVYGVLLLFLGCLLQLNGLILVEWPRPEIPIHRHLLPTGSTSMSVAGPAMSFARTKRRRASSEWSMATFRVTVMRQRPDHRGLDARKASPEKAKVQARQCTRVRRRASDERDEPQGTPPEQGPVSGKHHVQAAGRLRDDRRHRRAQRK